jgi:hypothetical protein
MAHFWTEQMAAALFFGKAEDQSVGEKFLKSVGIFRNEMQSAISVWKGTIVHHKGEWSTDVKQIDPYHSGLIAEGFQE